jgi:hypothetical protein
LLDNAEDDTGDIIPQIRQYAELRPYPLDTLSELVAVAVINFTERLVTDFGVEGAKQQVEYGHLAVDIDEIQTPPNAAGHHENEEPLS